MPLVSFDESLFLWFNGACSGTTLTAFMSAATWLGNAVVLAVIILPAIYLRDRARFRTHALAMGLAVALSGLVVNAAKVVVGRPRPPEYFADSGLPLHVPLTVPSDFSFPSGHSQTAFGVAAYLSCLYPAGAPAFLALALLVALSRVALGVHFPSDVVVGAVAGALTSVVMFHVVRRRSLPLADKATVAKTSSRG